VTAQGEGYGTFIHVDKERRSKPPKRWTGLRDVKARRRHLPHSDFDQDLFDIKCSHRAGSRALDDSPPPKPLAPVVARSAAGCLIGAPT